MSIIQRPGTDATRRAGRGTPWLRPASAFALAAIVASAARAGEAEITFTRLAVPQTMTSSFGAGVADGGLAVVGSGWYAGGDQTVALRWRPGMPLEFFNPQGPFDTFARGLTPDGTIAVGSRGFQACRWSADGDLEILPGGFRISHANDVSADGGVIVGGDFDSNAIAWLADGSFIDLGTLPNYGGSFASAVSADGLTIVGACGSRSASPKAPLRPFRWTAAEGMQDLGLLEEGVGANATGVSRDGSVIVGTSNPGGRGGIASRAYRWTAESGVQALPVPPAALQSVAHRVSGDGRVAVGSAFRSGRTDAVAWTPALGMIDLNTFLAQRSVDLGGWHLADAYAISDDGSAITGLAFNSFGQDRAFLIRGLSLAELCPGDLDGSRRVDLLDLAVLLTSLGTPGGAKAEQGDVDGDGDVDLTDLSMLLAAYGADCG